MHLFLLPLTMIAALEFPEPWASSDGLRIAVHSAGSIRTLTTGSRDFKPSWSVDGRRLTFFRLRSEGGSYADYRQWRTSICVIDADGEGFRELTSGEHADFNPTWTRDGSNLILFNRLFAGGRNQVFRIAPDGAAGSEELLSDPAYRGIEWVTGALKDGRLFVDRIGVRSMRSYLLTPRPGRAGVYQEIRRPTGLLWHKLSISPDETRVAYMLDGDFNTATFGDAVICHARLNVAGLEVSDQVCITEAKPGGNSEYPCWNRDGSLILFDSDGAVYAHRVADGITAQVAPPGRHQFVTVKGVPR